MNDNWLPPGKTGAVCFSIDDIHPGKSTDVYDGGGDLGNGALGNIEWLLNRHKDLNVTLFTTADWREKSALPTKRFLSKVPVLKDKIYLADIWPKGKMRLDNHPEFVDYLKSLPRVEIGLHGLHHCHKGLNIPIEFQEQSVDEMRDILQRMFKIFNKARLPFVRGMCPPGWDAPENLLVAMREMNFKYLASSRDIFTPVRKDSLADMSGLKGVPLINPIKMEGDIVHIPTNFQATSNIERAFEIINNNGLVKIKAHIVKMAFGRMSLDGLDKVYSNYLDLLLTKLEERYGNDLWWPSLGELSDRVRKTE